MLQFKFITICNQYSDTYHKTYNFIFCGNNINKFY